MQYLLAFLEGIITFLSPCLLPLLPVYLSYFAGQEQSRSNYRTWIGAMGFVSGFTVVFVAMGAFAGTLGQLFSRYATILNLITGAIVVMFGLNYLGVFKIDVLNKVVRHTVIIKAQGFFSAFIFGVVFSVGWTPCVGAFLGSALLLASQQGSVMGGTLMLFCYSLGLGVPFMLSALLLSQLQSGFSWIKTHYRVINLVSGLLLTIVGLLMMSGNMARFLAMFAV